MSAMEIITRPLAVVRHSAFRYVLVGGLSFLVDFGLIVSLRELADAPLWLATSAGFWGSLAFNFSMQRLVTFQSRGRWHIHLARYVFLLGINYVATVLLVLSAEAVGVGYAFGKLGSTGLLGVSTYFAYRYWVFHADSPPRMQRAGGLRALPQEQS